MRHFSATGTSPPQNQEPYQEIGAFPLQETEDKFSSEVFFTFFWILRKKTFPTLGDGAGLWEGGLPAVLEGFLLAMPSALWKFLHFDMDTEMKGHRQRAALLFSSLNDEHNRYDTATCVSC